MSKSSTNVRAALDEARLSELLRKAQDSFLEIKAEKESLAKEGHRLAVLDAVLGERKVLLDQREVALKKQEDACAERESRVQRAEADLASNASFLNKLKAPTPNQPAAASTAPTAGGPLPSRSGVFAKPTMPQMMPPPLTQTGLPPSPPLPLPPLSGVFAKPTMPQAQPGLPPSPPLPLPSLSGVFAKPTMPQALAQPGLPPGPPSLPPSGLPKLSPLPPLNTPGKRSG